jgi:hypothetical protein
MARDMQQTLVFRDAGPAIAQQLAQRLAQGGPSTLRPPV